MIHLSCEVSLLTHFTVPLGSWEHRPVVEYRLDMHEARSSTFDTEIKLCEII